MESDQVVPDLLRFSDRLMLGVSMVGFSIITICGSFLVVASVTIHSKKIKSRNNIFIINLMIADFIVGVLTMPITSSSVLQNKWVFGADLCNTSGFLDNVALVSSLWTMAMSSVDRYYFVTHPFTYFKVMSHKRIVVMLVFSWLHSSLLAACPLFGWDSYVYSPYSFNCGIKGSNDAFHRYYFITFFMLSIPVPVFLCAYFYFKLLIITRKRLNSRSKRQQASFPTATSSCPVSTVQFSDTTAFSNVHFKYPFDYQESSSTAQDPVSRNSPEEPIEGPVRRTLRQHQPEHTPGPAPQKSKWRWNRAADHKAANTNEAKASIKIRRSRNTAMQRKVTVSVFIIVGCYMLFTMPLFVTGLAHWISKHPINIPIKWALLAHWLFIGKSACNPILFASLNPQIQGGFKQLIGFCKCR
ncbi:rhodopsin-like [Bolinopsis microptera]|uniref:rhodopsin-like n=1 Tax=Bolinopsis microptera TaxID=2820187 RepID=UPI003079AB73